MKGQSNRLQSMDPPDDWVNGSWTVDCICGVNFDDGEEMVNCDECGVWVHTRCSRYVKGDDIFVCDKCKGKNERNDREETEVAQLLVELPTKTMSMESTYVCNGPSQRPFRLWTDIPIEERVHVHGVPGGDPALFSGLSSLFTPQLWNCTGYVPKKFSFQYREFPCWDEDQSDNTDNEKNENPADKGAGVLFSLSKDNVLATPVAALIGMRSKVGDVLCDRNGLLSEKQGVSEDLNRSAENGVRERSFLRPLILHSGKCKKEDYLVSKDQSGKMKSTSSDKVTNMKKRIDHTSKIVFTSMNDEKQSADRDLKHARGDSENPRNKSSREMVVRESSSNAYDVANKNHDNSRYGCELSPDIVSSEISKNNSVNAVGPKEENGVQVSLTVENSTKIEGDAPSIFAKKDVGNVVMKQGGGTALDYADDGGFSRSIVKPSVEILASTKLESNDDQIHEDVNCGNSIDSLQTNVRLKIDKQHDVSGGALNFQASARADSIEMQKCNDRMPESFKVNSGGVVCGSQLGGHKAERCFEAASNYRLEKADEQFSNSCEFKQEWEWPEGSTTVHISSLKPQNGSEFGSEKPSKSGGTALHQHVLPSQHKTTLGKSAPASSNVIISKPSVSNDLTPADPENLEGTATKHEAVSGSCGGSRKECSSNDVDRDEERDKLHRRRIKEHPKECLNAAAASNSLYSVRDLQDPISKRNTLHLKDSVVLSTVKTSLVHNVPDSSGYSESIESHLNHKGLTPHSKVSGSCLPQRGDKPNHPPSKVNQRYATAMYPPAATNPPAVLSDEELAFLLHQELNSSPRVPRVPRLRQTGSSPQLGSPNATSMLIKRTSSSRGRDHASASRMKNKDASRDAFRSSREPDDDVKRTDEVLSSPDQRRQETSNSAEASKREENGSPIRLNVLKKGLLSAYATNTASNSAEASKREENGSPTRLIALKKGLLSAYATNTASSGPSSSMEANDHNNSSIRNSPRNTSDDDTGTVGEGPVHHTLPGLINEIMSKGRRMTYEELCNAVLPHWHNLRKHNGERYAYSSHSQAVLDCLRNRHEWARLVDRGPKTNSSRKRRKFDVEESDDSEYGKGRTVKVIESKGLESQKEEFPKRKRNTRKRKLALQGKGIKDIRKRRKTEMFTDDDVGLLSDSSDGSMFSEDELQDVDECSERREASGSDE